MEKRIIFIVSLLLIFAGPRLGFALDLGNGFSLKNVTYLDFTSASGDLFDTGSSKNISDNQAKANAGLADGFHFSRVYLTFAKEFNDQLLVRITTDQMTSRSDGNSEATPFGLSGFAGAGRGNIFVKYVYVQYKFLPELMIRAGLTQTPWIDEAENRWTLRFLRPTFWDEQGALTSSDLGVSLLGALFNNMVSYHVMFSSGEGYENGGTPTTPGVSSSGLDGRGFAGQGRIDLNPIQGVTLSAFGLMETYHGGVSGWNPNREIFYAMYTHDLFRVAAEYIMAEDNSTGSNPLTIMTTPGSVSGSKGPATSTNTARFDHGRGYGAWAWIRMPELEPLRLFGRFYIIRPNNTTEAGKLTEINGGISYDLTKEISLAVDDTFMAQKLLNIGTGGIETFRDHVVGVRALLTF